MPVAVTIIRQTVDDILGHPQKAFVCLLPTLGGWGLALGLYNLPMEWFPWLFQTPEQESRVFPTVTLTVICALLFVTGPCWTAVAWHRKVILAEATRRLLTVRLLGVSLWYIWTSFFLSVNVLVLMIPLAYALPISDGLVPFSDVAVSFDLGGPPPGFAPRVLLAWIIINGLYLGLFLRLSLVLPALAVGKPVGFEDVWRITAGHFYTVFLPLGVLLPMINTVFSLLSGLVSFGGVLEILSVALLFLLGIGVLTRLYLHFFPPDIPAEEAPLPAPPVAGNSTPMTQFTDAARAATLALRDLFPETPLQRNDHLCQQYDADIWLKREDLSPVRSYKLRGALTALRKHLAAHPDQQRFVCASAGNHAQGVAYACRHFGVRGTIFMPVTTPQQKIDKTRTFGGDAVEIVLTGDYFDQTLAAAQTFCAQTGAHFLSPFDDPDVIEGQASVGVEILDQLGRAPDLVVLPVGGGGLSSGVTGYLREAAPQTRYRFVEPVGGASLTAALAAGTPATLPRINSFVDGAAVARIGANNYTRLNWVDPAHVLLAPEDRICVTMLQFLNIEGIVLEPAGALAVDVLPDLADVIRGKTVVCITSGGNFDFERLPEVKERAQRYAGLKKYFILRMPQRPGALREFLMMLGPDDDIARFEYLKKSARNFGSVLIGIETKAAQNFDQLYGRMDAAGFSYRDITQDEALAEFLI